MKLFSFRFWPILFIFTVWFIFSSQYFIKGHVPFPSKYLVTFFPPWSAEYGMPVKNNAMPDVITQIYPWKRFTIETWKMGQVPLWNPYSFAGSPHLANYQSAVLSPINLLFFILPEVDAWSLMILLQPLLAGLFMYFLLRTLERSNPASTLGAISFMFFGFMTVWMAYGTLGWAILWLPLALAAATRQFNKRSRGNIVLLSGSLALSFVSGHFQTSLYVLAAVLAFILFETIRRRAYKAGAKLFAAVFIGLLLSAPQLLPSAEAYQNSVRSELFTQSGGIAWQYLITLFAPDFFGNPVTRNDWFGYYAEWASYIGVIPLLLALYAAIRKKASTAWFFIGLAIVSLLAATPTPLNGILILLKLPAISTSYAARIIVLVSFSLIVLAAYGLDKIADDWRKQNTSRFAQLVFFVGLFLAVLWMILVFVKPITPDKLLIASRNAILPTALALVASSLFLAGFIRRGRFTVLISFVLVGLVAFDLLRYATKWMPFDPREFVYPQTEILAYLSRELTNQRIFGNLGGEVANTFRLASLEGYDAVYQKRYGEFIGSVSDGHIIMPERSVVQFPKYGAFSEKMLQLLGVGNLVHRLSDGRLPWAYPYWRYPNYESIYRSKHYEVFRNEEALPRAFLASSYRVAGTDREVLDTLYEPAFDLENSVVLEEKPFFEPQAGEGTVEIVKYTPNEVFFTTNSSAPKLLFLSDVYDKGWKASIDGKAASIYKADYDFRAVAVPAGEHSIRMYYWPDGFVLGLWLAGVALAILCILVFIIRI